MAIPELSTIEIFGKDPNRQVKCCYCSDVVTRSILPHVRSKHPDKWEKWKEEILESYNQGNNPKKIMEKIFTVNSRPLFTWSVIEKEITKMIEEGKDVKLPVKENIDYLEPKDNGFMEKLDKTTTWHFTKRGDWATHNGNYRGNWPPQIPRYFIMKYSDPGELVFDGFMGGGTTIVECRLLGRNAIGYDINPFAVKITKKQLEIIDKEISKSNLEIPNSEINVMVNDVRDLRHIDDNSIDLICTHPPYFNSLKYTNSNIKDLSRINKTEIFLNEIAEIAQDFFRILKPSKICCLLIGDVRIKNNLFPLGNKVMDKFLDKGFTLKDTIIKEQYNDRSTAFYVNKKIRRISHEYLFVFQKSK